MGHKTQRRDLFFTALYSFHKGYWYSIPDIIWRQLHKFWEGVHQRAVDTSRSWGLSFPFIITFMLRKKGIKGTAADGPISVHPYFGRIQWSQIYSHMPRGHRARAADKPEMMDIEEPAAQPEAAIEPDAADDHYQEGEEYEETITISASNLVALQDTLDDMRFKIDNIERDARQA